MTIEAKQEFSPEEFAKAREAEAGARKRHDDAKKAAGLEEPASPAPIASVARLTFTGFGGGGSGSPAFEQQEREREQRREAGRLRQLHRRLQAIPQRFAWARFDDPTLAKRVESRSALGAAQKLTGHEDAVFIGPSGKGKTSLAAAAARAVILASDDVNPYFESAYILAGARARHGLGEGEPESVQRALSCDLLILDELGSDDLVHGSAIKDVVFERNWRSRPTWVTTWMTPDQVAAKYGDGIARRLFEDGVTRVIDCGGKP